MFLFSQFFNGLFLMARYSTFFVHANPTFLKTDNEQLDRLIKERMPIGVCKDKENVFLFSAPNRSLFVFCRQPESFYASLESCFLNC